MTILYNNQFVDYDEYVEENQNGDQLLILNLVYKFYHTTTNRPNRLEKRLRQKIKGTETNSDTLYPLSSPSNSNDNAFML